MNNNFNNLDKDPLKLLCVFSGLLGNGTLSLRLEEMIRKMPGVEAQFVYITMQDFIDVKAPWWIRWSNSWEAAYVTGKVLAAADIKPFDAVFVNGLEHVLSTGDWIKNYPSIIGCDATPNLSQAQIRTFVTSPIRRAKSYLTNIVMNRFYRNIFKYNDFFVPMSQWCADDFVRSYGVRPEQCLVSYVPIDFSRWPVKERAVSRKKKILFVGNHFTRKGGDVVLDIYARYLKDKAELTIISNDPVLDAVNQDDVRILRDIPHAQIGEYFVEADLFVFPTRKEYLGAVVTEAMASGLPVIARDVGALREFVITGKTGTLMPYEATPQQWAQAILELLEDPERMQQYSKAARQLAEEMFSFEVLYGRVEGMLEGLGIREQGAGDRE